VKKGQWELVKKLSLGEMKRTDADKEKKNIEGSTTTGSCSIRNKITIECGIYFTVNKEK